MSIIGKTLLITACLTILTSNIVTAKSRLDLKDQNFVIPKDSEVLPQAVSSYLHKQNNETVKIWVFFVDKGFSNKSGFSQIASTVQLSEKVLKRRKKVNLDKVLFVDLPVYNDYLNQVKQVGAKHRRSSRWLNAASFEVPIKSLDEISNLPFVKSIKPMVGFKKDYSELSTVDNSQLDKTSQSPLNANALNYGSSFVQLAQINVPAVHQKGYTGAGVTLCITDTGYRKSHDAFAAAFAAGRVLAEYDFVFNDGNTANEAGDWSSQWNHGTLVWSVSAGNQDGTIYGPAYNANILLAKTEDVRSETQIEEDNWVAALEWADSLGADVISTSLGYSDWYTQASYDWNTAVITLAANTCASLGIVLCNSMGNSGSAPTTLSAPADAFDILSIGAVDNNGIIASFSSRGPTADGRMKPEVCAMGVTTFSASSSGDGDYTTASGTSLSTPLVAGAACLLIEARPAFSPLHIRQALMETADRASNPDNNYGWGIMNIDAALGWGATITADIQTGDAPITVNFSGTSPLTVTSWLWDFGDGNSSTLQNPSHTYTSIGLYDVSLTVDSDAGIITNNQVGFVSAFGDTMAFIGDSVFAGKPAVLSVSLTNSQPLSEIQIPFQFFDSPALVLDSVTLGTRTSYFEDISAIAFDSWNNKYTYKLQANIGGGAPDLPSGSGEVMRLHFKVNEWELGGLSYLVDTTTAPFALELTSPAVAYGPVFQNGSIKTITVMRGDLDYNFQIDISDLVAMVSFAFTDGLPGVSNQTFDVNADLSMDISDIVFLVAYMFQDGPPPVSP